MRVCNQNSLCYFSSKTFVVVAKKNRFKKTVFEHPQHMFKLMDKKILYFYALEVNLSGNVHSLDVWKSTLSIRLQDYASFIRCATEN